MTILYGIIHSLDYVSSMINALVNKIVPFTLVVVIAFVSRSHLMCSIQEKKHVISQGIGDNQLQNLCWSYTLCMLH